MVLQRVLEKKEPLRKVADDHGVSQETIRRLVRAARRSSESRLRMDTPRSQHTSSVDTIRAPRSGAKTGRHGLWVWFFLLLHGCKWWEHAVAEQGTDDASEHDGARPEMDRPRNPVLKTQWFNDGQVEEVEEVEDRWHRESENADAFSSLLRRLESLVE